ncbi:diguanylate cyclase domain-containing protein [Chitinimonas sp. PSY-7]|uniref:diguanylate cyclase domain-containing protein n=1 Tax=Chitinimonas sp. PSY-7 TaxID=3459088 RepID=UPI00403FEB95
MSNASDTHRTNPLLDAPEDRPCLLLVDDQAINIQTMYQIFHNDHEVFMATSGTQALEFCQNKQPDLILLDVIMPDLDGYEVCRQLKQDPLTQDIPVIFVTAQDNPTDEEKGLDAGAVDFISKPVNPKVVRARVRTHLTLKRQSDLLRSLAFVDGLTGVANRRNFDETLASEWRRSLRSGQTLSLIILDIDFFKRYNDHYGHQAGDLCLRAVANALRKCINRSHDLVARYGGEEFVCILPETPLSGAETMAHEMELAVRQLGIAHARSDIADVVTISLGVASAPNPRDEGPEKLISTADNLLYAAKQAGRGQYKTGSVV